ncbi:MAG: TonB family protein [Nitrospira sp.]|nr:TonB family protein [Nitrospira sp.]
MAQASGSADFWLSDERQTDLSRRLWRAVAISLVVHVGVLAVVSWIRLPKHGERPLASIEITLATMPAPPVNADEPKQSEPKAAEVPALPPPARPAPLAKMAPAPAPVKARSNDVMGDVMKGISLPANAPKFGDFSPTEKPKKQHIKLPDVPVVTEATERLKNPETKPQPSLTEDLNKELDEEFKRIKKFELPKAAPADIAPKPAPHVETKAPSIKAVDTTLKVPGMAPGSNAYLGRVRQRISSFWNAPPVDAAGQGYVVIVQFRLHRNGSVTGVAIEQSSGNEYYDLAGKRAVLSATPLPVFPPELTEPYFDAHFTFTVGESQG